MTQFPDDWYRDSPARSGSPGSPGYAGQAAGPAGNGWPGAGADTDPGLRPQRGGWPVQPPPAPADPGRRSGPPGSGRRPRRRLRLLLAVLAVLVVLAAGLSVGGYLYLSSQLTKKNVLISYAGQPAAGAGQNWLITGSDSRQGLSTAEARRLSTGTGIAGQRSDTIMLLHVPPGGGRPILISFPRDSYVDIPGFGWNKLNAAYADGGPQLLVRTLETTTGLRINHYMGIGFGGFVQVVNAVGGVRLCLKAPLDDPNAGLHLQAGCQTLNGAQALGYVRSRETFATQDLQRVQDQRVFLRALLRKMTSASVLLDPLRSWPAASGVAGTLTVDQGTSLYQLVRVAFALRNPITTTVPVSDPNYLTPDAGDALLWNKTEARQLFNDLRTGQPVPRSLITGSHQAG